MIDRLDEALKLFKPAEPAPTTTECQREQQVIRANYERLKKGRSVDTEADRFPREALLSHLEHVDRETIGVDLAIPVGPKAIHPIALDAFNGHQWPP
jgi:hypothetical protein